MDISPTLDRAEHILSALQTLYSTPQRVRKCPRRSQTSRRLFAGPEAVPCETSLHFARGKAPERLSPQARSSHPRQTKPHKIPNKTRSKLLTKSLNKGQQGPPAPRITAVVPLRVQLPGLAEEELLLAHLRPSIDVKNAKSTGVSVFETPKPAFRCFKRRFKHRNIVSNAV